MPTESFKVSTELDATGIQRGARRATRSLDTMAGATVGATNAMRTLGLIMGGVGVSIGGALIIHQIAQFEQSMAQVAAISGATGNEFERLERLARRLGATTVFTARQAADAQRFLSLAGFQSQEIVAALPSVLTLARAGMLELEEAANITAAAIRGFNLEASEAGRVANVLALTQASANTNVSQLGEALRYVAPIAASAGIEIETVAAAIGRMSDAGLQATLAGTSLRRVIINLEAPTSTGIKAFRQLGIEVNKVRPSVVGLVPAIRELRQAGVGLTEAVDIFGVRGGPGFLVLRSYVRELEELETALNENEDAAVNMALTMDDTLAASMKALNSVISETVLGLGDAGLNGALRSTVEFATGVIAVWNDMNHEFAIANRLTYDQTQIYRDWAEWIGNAGKALAYFVGAAGLGALLVGIGRVSLALGRLALAHPYIFGATAALTGIAYLIDQFDLLGDSVSDATHQLNLMDRAIADVVGDQAFEAGELGNLPERLRDYYTQATVGNLNELEPEVRTAAVRVSKQVRQGLQDVHGPLSRALDLNIDELVKIKNEVQRVFREGVADGLGFDAAADRAAVAGIDAFNDALVRLRGEGLDGTDAEVGAINRRLTELAENNPEFAETVTNFHKLTARLRALKAAIKPNEIQSIVDLPKTISEGLLEVYSTVGATQRQTENLAREQEAVTDLGTNYLRLARARADIKVDEQLNKLPQTYEAARAALDEWHDSAVKRVQHMASKEDAQHGDAVQRLRELNEEYTGIRDLLEQGFTGEAFRDAFTRIFNARELQSVLPKIKSAVDQIASVFDPIQEAKDARASIIFNFEQYAQSLRDTGASAAEVDAVLTRMNGVLHASNRQLDDAQHPLQAYHRELRRQAEAIGLTERELVALNAAREANERFATLESHYEQQGAEFPRAEAEANRDLAVSLALVNYERQQTASYIASVTQQYGFASITQAEFIRRQDTLNQVFRDGKISVDGYRQALLDLKDSAGVSTFGDKIEVGLRGAQRSVDEIVSGSLVNLSSSLAQVTTDWLQGTNSLKDAMKDLARTILNTVVKALIQELIIRLIIRAISGGITGGIGGGAGAASYGGVSQFGSAQTLTPFNLGSATTNASGGYIRGPGTGTSDSIPAFLSNGEFVINADATKRYLPLLEAINRGEPKGYNAGGRVGGRTASAPIMGDINISLIDAREVGEFPLEIAEARREAETGKIVVTVKEAFNNGGFDNEIRRNFGLDRQAT